MLKMRITGGKYCNRKVIIPEGSMEIRPAMDRMRESLFSILGPLDGYSFCDLFSGSACVGLEAASRGASTVHCVEMDRKKRPIMEQNISFAKDECDIRLFFSDVLVYIPACKTSYDIVYADPPFPMENKTKIAYLVNKKKTVVPGGLFIVHIPATEENQWEEQIGYLSLIDTRKYGRNMIKFYRMIEETMERE